VGLGQRRRSGGGQEGLHPQTTAKIKGSDVTRVADEARPAELIKQGGGDRMLKSVSEVRSV